MFESIAILQKDGSHVDLFLPIEKWKKLVESNGGSNQLTIVLRMDHERPKTREMTALDYARVIAEKFKEHGQIDSFFDHWALHLTEMVVHCLKHEPIPKKEVVSLQNFINVWLAYFNDEITDEELLERFDNHHQKSKRFTVGRDGSVKR
jgi:hypothetical protein